MGLERSAAGQVRRGHRQREGAKDQRPPRIDGTWLLQVSYRKLTSPEPSATSLAEFGRLAGDASVSQGHDGNGYFDVAGWYETARNLGDESRQPIVGATYIDRNVEFFVKMLEARGASAKVGAQRQMRLFWYRSGGTSWGVTPDLESSISSIRGAVRRISRSWQLRTTLIVPQVSRTENNRRFERLFDEAYLAPAGRISPSVEILLAKEVGAIVTVYVRLSEAVIVPVGFVFFAPRAVAALEALLRIDDVQGYTTIWHRAPEPIEEDPEADSGSQ